MFTQKSGPHLFIHFPSELPNCGEAAGAQRERVQGRAEGDLHVRVQPDRPRLREEDLGGGAEAVPAGDYKFFFYWDSLCGFH